MTAEVDDIEVSPPVPAYSFAISRRMFGGNMGEIQFLWVPGRIRDFGALVLQGIVYNGNPVALDDQLLRRAFEFVGIPEAQIRFSGPRLVLVSELPTEMPAMLKLATHLLDLDRYLSVGSHMLKSVTPTAKGGLEVVVLAGSHTTVVAEIQGFARALGMEVEVEIDDQTRRSDQIHLDSIVYTVTLST